MSITRRFPAVPVIDGHHHFWELSRFPYRWLAPDSGPARFGAKDAIQRNYLPQDYLSDMTAIDLVGSVHVQANSGAADPVDETRWLEKLADQSGWPSAIIAEVDLLAPDAAVDIARHAIASARLRGIRTPVAWDEAGRWRVASRANVLADAGFRKSARELAARNLVLEMVVVPDQLPEVAELARAMPALRIVINHFATLEPAVPGNADIWLEGIASIAQRQNVFLKLSGLWTVDKSWSAKVLRPYVMHALAHLGPQRILYGSNLPVEGVNCSALQQFHSLEQILSDVPDAAIQAIFSGTARNLYRLA
ncbi:amidohydrolase [Yoonia sp. R2331]|uniref:amidohydrolase family protein n=1 Tax=Yoonia sp. R2331 TaxID=3237238 RepID=UPI0034E587F5